MLYPNEGNQGLRNDVFRELVSLTGTKAALARFLKCSPPLIGKIAAGSRILSHCQAISVEEATEQEIQLHDIYPYLYENYRRINPLKDATGIERRVRIRDNIIKAIQDNQIEG